MRYFLKWKRLTDTDNPLELEEHLDCPELIEAFLNSQKAGKEKDGTKRKYLIVNLVIANHRRKEILLEQEVLPEVLIQNKQLVPQTSVETLMIFMKWKTSDEVQLVQAIEVNMKCPQIIIAFL